MERVKNQRICVKMAALSLSTTGASNQERSELGVGGAEGGASEGEEEDEDDDHDGNQDPDGTPLSPTARHVRHFLQLLQH